MSRQGGRACSQGWRTSQNGVTWRSCRRSRSGCLTRSPRDQEPGCLRSTRGAPTCRRAEFAAADAARVVLASSSKPRWPLQKGPRRRRRRKRRVAIAERGLKYARASTGKEKGAGAMKTGTKDPHHFASTAVAGRLQGDLSGRGSTRSQSFRMFLVISNVVWIWVAALWCGC